jgi:hypothetical protein
MLKKIIIQNISLILVGVFTITSCSKKEKNTDQSTPKGIINQQTMALIAAELSMLESARALNLLTKIDSTKNETVLPDIPKFQEAIFKKYGTTKAQYDSSFNYYSKNPKLLMEIFENAASEISTLQAKKLNK